MFKVKNKWVVENGTMPILEDYGFKYHNALYHFYEYKYNFSMIRIDIDSREFYMYENTFSNDLLKIFYKLIKDDIIEEV